MPMSKRWWTAPLACAATLLLAVAEARALRHVDTSGRWIGLALVVVTLVAGTSVVHRRWYPDQLASCALLAPLLAQTWHSPAWAMVVWAAPSLGIGALIVGRSARLHRMSVLTWITTVLSVLTFLAHLTLVNRYLVIRCGRFCPQLHPLLLAHRPDVIVVLRLVLGTVATLWVVSTLRAHPMERVPMMAAVGTIVAVTLSPDWLLTMQVADWGSVAMAVVASIGLVVAVARDATLDFAQFALRQRVRAASRAVGTDRDHTVEALLRDACRDPRLRLLYPSTNGTFLDVRGEVVELEPWEAVVRLTRHDAVVAVLATDDAARIGGVLTPQLLLAIENEGLLVQSQALLAELQKSRERLVASADETRHRLERDLHDGAQQRLLAIALMLRSADMEDSTRSAAMDEATAALDELRRIARGLYPVSLDKVGLVAALESYLDEAPVAVELDVGPLLATRSQATDRTGYRIVRTFVEAAAGRQATVVTVHVTESDHRLVVELEHDGSAIDDMLDLDDRVGALGGHWSYAVRDGHQVATAVLPCG
jgi:signal transduction histidine kinase